MSEQLLERWAQDFFLPICTSQFVRKKISKEKCASPCLPLVAEAVCACVRVRACARAWVRACVGACVCILINIHRQYRYFLQISMVAWVIFVISTLSTVYMHFFLHFVLCRTVQLLCTER